MAVFKHCIPLQPISPHGAFSDGFWGMFSGCERSCSFTEGTLTCLPCNNRAVTEIWECLDGVQGSGAASMVPEVLSCPHVQTVYFCKPRRVTVYFFHMALEGNKV